MDPLVSNSVLSQLAELCSVLPDLQDLLAHVKAWTVEVI
jgi:hypothetical protein